MRKTIILFTALFTATLAYSESGKEIMQKAENLTQPQKLQSIGYLTIHKRGRIFNKMKLRVSGIKNGRNEKILLKVTAPARDKIKVLTFTNRGGSDQQWIKYPSMSNPKKIVSGDRKKAFKSSHFFFEDLKSRDVDDYNYTILGTEKKQGNTCWKIQAKPKPGKSIYQKAVFYVIKPGQKFSYFIVQVDIYYQGYLYKRAVNYDIKKTDGIITPYKAVMYRLNRQGKVTGKSILEIKKIRYKSRYLRQSMFHPSRL